MTSSDPYISKAMAELQKLDDIEQISDQEDRSDSMHVDATQEFLCTGHDTIMSAGRQKVTNILAGCL